MLDDAAGSPVDDLAPLMKRYQAGEEAAFEEIYHRMASVLGSYLKSLVPPGADVRDLVQGTFLQIHRARHTYLPCQPVRPWLFAIARHVGLMARRAAGRRARNEVLPADDLPEVSVLSRVAGALDRIGLERAMEDLGAPAREAVWLHHVAGLSFREVGAVQGVSETAAKVRSHRAIVHLRERLAASDG